MSLASFLPVPPRGLPFVLACGLLASAGGYASAIAAIAAEPAAPPAATAPSPGAKPARAVAPAVPPDLALPEPAQLALEGVPWLLPEDGRRALAAEPPAARAATVQALLAAPGSAVLVDELREGVRRRRALMLAESLTVTDDRARLLFLHGAPSERQPVDCSAVFRPLEIWRYGGQRLVLYRPAAGEPYRMWLPIDGKAALYTHEMVSWLDDWAALAGRFSGRRIDQRLCKLAPAVDAATGVDGLGAALSSAPPPGRLLAFLAAPADLRAWAHEAALQPVTKVASLPVQPLAISFPRRDGQRLEARLIVVVQPEAPLSPAVEKTPLGNDTHELRIDVEGVVESDRALFDSFRMRFTSPLAPGKPLVLSAPRLLRPGTYVVRLRVRDEVGGAQTVIGGEIEVPSAPRPSPADSLVANTALDTDSDRLERKLATGEDALVLMVPPRDVVLDGVRAQALVRGERIQRVAFLLDGKPQLTRTAPPWSVDVKLPRLPREEVLRAEGYDSAGKLIASDEVTLNQLKGQLEVTVLQPPPKSHVVGDTLAKAQVVVPEDRRVSAVEFRVNEQLQATLQRPPWEARVRIPDAQLAYLTVSAELDDGTRAEDVRILAAPSAMAQVDVSQVDLYTTVTNSSGELVPGLEASDFEVREDGRKQKVSRAQLVTDLPLTLGIALDISGSMQQALGEAQRAAATFLQTMVRPRDRCFAVAFSDRPSLVMPRTPDAAAAAKGLSGLRANGFTTFNDAIVFSLYYFQGTRGRRALVVLSDGADTDSRLTFDEALGYAKDSGVVIYTIGLRTPDLDLSSRHKLEQLAQATGGRSFVIDKATELAGVYQRIESELRSQYLLGYAPEHQEAGKRFRRVDVKVVDKRGVTARTIPGYNG